LRAARAARLVVAATAGALLARGWFAPASALLTAGLLAHVTSIRSTRPGRGPSAASAVIDASADRYEELLVLGGLAFFFHSVIAPLGLTLVAMSGAYMAGYAIAKAQAHGAPLRGESTDRLAQALAFIAGVVLVPVIQLASTLVVLPSWAPQAPVLLALAFIAIRGNASAMRRLHGVAASAQRHQGDHRPATLVDIHRGVAQHAARVDVYGVLPGRDTHSRDGDARGQSLPASRVGGV
jgi:ABC-type glycerol-3-phosphate transport system permease component